MKTKVELLGSSESIIKDIKPNLAFDQDLDRLEKTNLIRIYISLRGPAPT